MRKNAIKKIETIEKVVRIEYVAEDGTVFYDEDECKKYEESALFAVSKKLKRLATEWTSHYALTEQCEESELEIFDVQTKEDLENLRRYLYLKAMKNGCGEEYIEECFTSKDGITRKNYVFDNVTVGHEVLIFWSYDGDWFWVYNDGSLEGYFKWVRDNYNKIITPKETESEVK